MTVPAFPPRSLCWSSWYFCRFQFILFIIPFTEKLTVRCRQIIISGKDFSLRTNGAYRTFHTGIDNWFPLVTAFTALPPNIFSRLCIYPSGFNGKFFSDHSEAISGCVVCKSLNPFKKMYPLQYGHLLPPERVEIRVFHSLPQSLHFHHALRLAKTVTWVGSNG